MKTVYIHKWKNINIPSQIRLPPNDDKELPKAGDEDAPNAGIELPKAGDDEAPKVVFEEKGDDVCAAPNTPVEVPPKAGVCDPNGVVGLPNGFGAKGLLLELFVCCPNTDCEDPNGLDDCPKAV